MSRWPDDLLFLLARRPRASWEGSPDIGELARFWLDRHQALHAHGDGLLAQARDWQEGRLAAPLLRQRFAAPLQHFLRDLQGHHHVEDAHYFPLFRTAEPRLASGFDLLEADHHLIHDQLLRVVDTARALLALDAASPLLPDAAARYVDAIAPLTEALPPHLADEEELVIPLLAGSQG